MLKKIFTYGFVEVLAKGLNKLTLLILPVFLGTAAYGKIGLIIGVELLLPLISLLGFDRAVLRFYSEKTSFSSFRKTVFSSILVTHIFGLFIVTALYLSGVRTVFGLSLFPDVFAVVILIYFQGVNSINLNIFRVEENHFKYYKGRLFIQVCKFLLVLTLVFLTESYMGYIYGAIIASIMSNIFFRVTNDENEEKSFETKTFKALFLFSWPFIFHGIASNFLGNADRFILQEYMSLDDVGLYTLIYSIGSMVVFSFSGVSIFLEPLIYKENRYEMRRLLLNKFLFFTLLIGLFSYLVITLASIYVLPNFYDAKFIRMFKYIPLIALAHLVFPYYLKSNYKLIYEKSSLKIASVSVLCSVINVGLNVVLIPKYGIFAAVVATLISYVIMGILFVLISNKFKLNRELFDVSILSSILISSTVFQLDYLIVSFMIALFLIYLYITKIRLKQINTP